MLFAVSRFTANLLRSQGIPNEKIQIVYNGANLNLFRPLRITEDIRKKYGVHGRRLLLTVCRLDPHKGVDLMLKAMPSLIEEFPDLIYVVIGNGSEYKKLKTLADSFGIKNTVKFLGYIPDKEVALWYNLCEIYVMLSHEIQGRTDLIEGFGISFVEAAACGKPSVACRFGGVVDAVRNGETGLLVDSPPQVNEIIDAVGRLLRSKTLGKKLGQAGRHRVERELNWEFAANQMFSIFKTRVEKL